IVLKLFNLVRADWAVFGRKDYQQWLIIDRMVKDLNLAVRLCAVDTQRETGGLALSSRNVYLSVEEKNRAKGIYQALCRAANELKQGSRNYAAIERKYATELEGTGFNVGYFSIRNIRDLTLPSEETNRWVILVAAKLGTTRLIDNLEVVSD
ncbi:MAG: pantoate--beta-alanine ligase, partial [Methylococcaceae bacterium]